MRRARLIPLFCLPLAMAAPLRAQWQGTVDAGLSRLQQTDIPQSTARTLGARLDAIGDRAWLSSSLLLANASASNVTGQGLVTGSLLGAPGTVRWELNGVVSEFGESGDLPTTTGELMARARLGDVALGGSLGAGAGNSVYAQRWMPVFRAQGDIWTTIQDEQFAGNLSFVRARTLVFSDGRSPSVPRVYADVAASWRHDAGAFGVSATAGVRKGFTNIADASSWGSVEGSAWVSAHSAIVVSVGRSIDDVVRGVPRTQYASVALRLATWAHAAISTRQRALSGVRISIAPSANGTQRIGLVGATGSRVEMMADFTNWNPVTLERDGDTWRIVRVVSPGLHRLAIRIDGGEWTAPANIPRVIDDLGGVVGLITVP